jgi:hypothetical protein
MISSSVSLFIASYKVNFNLRKFRVLLVNIFLRPAKCFDVFKWATKGCSTLPWADDSCLLRRMHW